MCIICIELEKQRLTALEAFRNLREMEKEISDEHLEEVAEKIAKKALDEEVQCKSGNT